MNEDERVMQTVKVVIPFRIGIFRVTIFKSIIGILVFVQCNTWSCIFCDSKIKLKKVVIPIEYAISS